MKHWNDLKWWNSKECVALHEKLHWHDYDKPWTWLPARGNVYRAFHVTPFDQVRVVILGQDPYHSRDPRGNTFATGMAFSVPPSIPRVSYPPSLLNIFKELVDDLHIPYPTTGDLTPWARQGVLLLNTALTVEAGRAGSHQKIGWDGLIREALSSIDEYHRGVVFLLWGREAQRYLSTVLPSISHHRHHVLCAPHPSPLSAYNGFFGSRPFSTTNALLVKSKQKPIDWRL